MATFQRFKDRYDAGRALAARLTPYRGRAGLLVLALPRGGVPVGYEVAAALGGELDVFLVRKLGAPGQEELAMGAIASGGVRVLNEDVLRVLGITQSEIEQATRAEAAELDRRERAYRGDRPHPLVAGRTVILVDDGLATGASMRAAAMALRALHPAELVVAVPVAAEETCRQFRAEVDRIVCAFTPEPFHAVGLWYEDFSQTSDAEVRELLKVAWEEGPAAAGMAPEADDDAEDGSPAEARGRG